MTLNTKTEHEWMQMQCKTLKYALKTHRLATLILANTCFVILKQTHKNFFSYAKIFTLTNVQAVLTEVLQS